MYLCTVMIENLGFWILVAISVTVAVAWVTICIYAAVSAVVCRRQGLVTEDVLKKGKEFLKKNREEKKLKKEMKKSARRMRSYNAHVRLMAFIHGWDI